MRIWDVQNGHMLHQSAVQPEVIHSASVVCHSDTYNSDADGWWLCSTSHVHRLGLKVNTDDDYDAMVDIQE